MSSAQAKPSTIHPENFEATHKIRRAEEAGCAYKDIELVVDSLEAAGITKRVVALKPIGNVKG